jgi:alkylation response protein AidB-like acyl-CoA dehydrogenase
MEFGFTPEQERLRREIRDFVESELAQGTFDVAVNQWVRGYSPEFSRKVAERGWIGLTWPREYGGGGLGDIERLVYSEEMLRYGAPVSFHWMGERQIGQALLACGTEEQRREFLPRITRAEISFCLLFSEPEAGTDLASVKTRARETEDGFILDGQKVWTSGGHHADYGWLLARTDPDVPKHKGISEFILDMTLPGVTVRPLIDMTGGQHVNEVFFDSVLVPKNTLVGQKNGGWKQLMAQIDHERSGMERVMGNYAVLTGLLDYCRTTRRDGELLSDKPLIRNRLAQLATEFEVGRLLVYRVAWLLGEGRSPTYEAALAKVCGTEFQQRLTRFATEILGLHGQVLPGSDCAPFGGIAAWDYSVSLSYTLQGGTSETMRNIVAMRGLGLPVG